MISGLFPNKYFLQDFTNRQKNIDQNIPIFKFPTGLEIISLFYLLQYYDNSALPFYEHFLFSDDLPNFDIIQKGQSEICDFYPYLLRILKFLCISIDPSEVVNIEKSIFQFFDYSMNFQQLFLNSSISNTKFIVNTIPHGNEEGIPYYLMHVSDFFPSYVFILDSVQFIKGIPANEQISNWSSIITTCGQPTLMNEIISQSFSTPQAIQNKEAQIPDLIKKIHCGEFEINWIIFSVSNCNFALLCRFPTFIRIGNGSTLIFSSIHEALKDAKIKLICYTHSSYDTRYIPKVYNSKPINLSKNIDSVILSNLSSLLPKIISKSRSFIDFVENSTLYPGFFLAALGYDLNSSISLSFNEAQNENEAKMRKDYLNFTMWQRAFTRVLKHFYYISNDETLESKLDVLLSSLKSCFAVLPVKSAFLTNATFQILVQAMKALHQRKNQNNAFFGEALKILRFVIGDDFDSILKISRIDIPKSIKVVNVSFEACQEEFSFKQFKSETKSSQASLHRFNKYMKLLGLDFFLEMPQFDYDPFFSQFHKSFAPYLAITV